MNEIRRGGLDAAGAHLARDLPAMIRRVQQDMGQDVLQGAIPRLSLAVFVSDIPRKNRRRKIAELLIPKRSEFGDLRLALVEGIIRPDRQTLGLLTNTLQP